MSNPLKMYYEADRARAQLLLLLCLHIAAFCLSLVYITKYYALYGFFKFDEAHLYPAVLAIAPLALFSILFVLARASFGYLLGFYFYTMVLGYLWLAEFSTLNYDHRLGSISAFFSVLAFLAPALFITVSVKPRFVLSRPALVHVLSL